MSVDVYVASRYEVGHRAAEVAENLEKLGCRITHEWWAALPSESKINCAVEDLEGVRAADILVALIHPTGGRGMWVEVGAALARGIPVYLIPENGIGAPPRGSIFDALCNKTSESGLYEIVTRAIQYDR